MFVPEFHRPQPIDLLISSGPTLQMLCVGQIMPFPGYDFTLQKTKLGWVVGGGACLSNLSNHKCMVSNLNFVIEKFWNIEELFDKKHLSADEKFCEEHLKKYTMRNQAGHNVVALPFKESIKNLGTS